MLYQHFEGNLNKSRWWRSISCQMSNLSGQMRAAIKLEIWKDSLAITRSKSLACCLSHECIPRGHGSRLGLNSCGSRDGKYRTSKGNCSSCLVGRNSCDARSVTWCPDSTKPRAKLLIMQSLMDSLRLMMPCSAVERMQLMINIFMTRLICNSCVWIIELPFAEEEPTEPCLVTQPGTSQAAPHDKRQCYHSEA